MAKKLFNIGLISVIFAALYHLVIDVLGWGIIALIISYVLVTAAFLLIYRAELLSALANSLYSNGNTRDAGEFYYRAYKWKPLNASVAANYGMLLTREGNAKKAIKVLSKALELGPSAAVEKSVMLSLGTAYWLDGDIDASISTFERMRTKFDYLNPSVLTSFGFAHFRKGNFEKALELSYNAVELEPENAAAWDNIGQIKLAVGEIDDARDAFMNALGFNPGLPDSLYYLGLISEKGGDYPLAAEYYKRAGECQLTPLNTITREMIDDRKRELGI